VRLAFAVAAHLEPDVLIVDEVLAVGDAEFQRKCLGRIDRVAAEGHTVLLVSHNLAAVQGSCARSLLLEKGRVVMVGDTAACIEAYAGRFVATHAWTRPERAGEAHGLRFERAGLRLEGTQPRHTLEVELVLSSHGAHRPGFLALEFTDAGGIQFMQALPTATGFLEPAPGRRRVRLSVELPPLIPGRYLVGLWAGSHFTETLDEVPAALSFDVVDSPTADRLFPHTSARGHVVPASRVASVEPA
jgi:hypothetical protein